MVRQESLNVVLKCKDCGQEPHRNENPTMRYEYSLQLNKCILTNIPKLCKYFCTEPCDCNSEQYREAKPYETQKAILEKYRPVFEKLAKE